MKILAIDTAGWSASVALWEDGCELAFEENTQMRDQAVILPGLVENVLEGCHLRLDPGSHRHGVLKQVQDDSVVQDDNSVQLILVNRGPGSFTGIRVGLAFARGLALGLAVPLKGIDSFMATYQSLNVTEDVLVLLEAHRQDVFGRLFQKGLPLDPHSLTRQDIEKILESPTPPLLGGSGVHPFCEGLVFKEAQSSWKGAQRLAYAFFKDQTLALEPSPFYGREADVSFSVSF